jgi:hypothetical protein
MRLLYPHMAVDATGPRVYKIATCLFCNQVFVLVQGARILGDVLGLLADEVAALEKAIRVTIKGM